MSLGTLGVPTMVLYNGKISTVDKHNSTVEAIAIRDGEIMATGEQPLRSRRWRKHGTKLDRPQRPAGAARA